VTGTWLFLRAFLRRDRWMYLWWGLGVALLYVSQAWSVDGLYPTQEEFDRYFAALSEKGEVIMPPDGYEFSARFAWLTDRFGVSWRLNLVPSRRARRG